MTKLSIANALFADNSVPVLDSYREIAGKFYKAEIANMDFAESDASMKRINDWCSKNTNGMIPSVLDEMSPKIVLYMFNALYFKGEWKAKFKTADTADEAFTDEAGVKSKIPMMKQVQKHDYMENEVFQAVDLAYGNEAFSMTVLLPKPGHKVADVIAALKDSPLDKVRGKMYNSELSLWLPKFETKSRIKLNDILSAMGMKQAFNSSQADFSALSPVRLWLNYLQQDAVIKVDEEGSEAAAVSQGGFSKELAAEPDVFHADHPFLYLISERSTGAILFAGRFSGK